MQRMHAGGNVREKNMVTNNSRDPARIEPLLEDIKILWQACPDLRFGQLLENVILMDLKHVSIETMPQKVEQALWNWEEDRWRQAVFAMQQKLTTSTGGANETL